MQVISLGAGYGTFAFRTLLLVQRDAALTEANTMRGVCQGVATEAVPRLQFFDVDFPAVMHAKAGLMAAAPAGCFDALSGLRIDPAATDNLPVRNAQYHAVGVDLREAAEALLPRLDSTAATTSFSRENPTVVYAGCIMQYMPPDTARALVAYIAGAFPRAIFLAYDPLQPGDSFGRTMLSSLRQKNIPRLGIDAAPDGAAMTRCAVDCGMAEARFANFYNLSRFHFSPVEEARVKGLETFDELEEWTEMCEHYGITMGFVRAKVAAAARREEVRWDGVTVRAAMGNPAYQTRHAATDALEMRRPVSPPAHQISREPWPSGRFSFEGWAAYAETDPRDVSELLIVSCGGYCIGGKTSARVRTVYVHGLREGELNVTTASAPLPPCSVFHSLTRLGPFRYLLFGGRCNPMKAFNYTYLLPLAPSRPSAARAPSLRGRPNSR